MLFWSFKYFLEALKLQYFATLLKTLKLYFDYINYIIVMFFDNIVRHSQVFWSFNLLLEALKIRCYVFKTFKIPFRNISNVIKYIQQF